MQCHLKEEKKKKERDTTENNQSKRTIPHGSLQIVHFRKLLILGVLWSRDIPGQLTVAGKNKESLNHRNSRSYPPKGGKKEQEDHRVAQ